MQSGRNWPMFQKCLLIAKMGAVSTYEASVSFYQTTRRNMQPSYFDSFLNMLKWADLYAEINVTLWGGCMCHAQIHHLHLSCFYFNHFRYCCSIIYRASTEILRYNAYIRLWCTSQAHIKSHLKSNPSLVIRVWYNDYKGFSLPRGISDDNTSVSKTLYWRQVPRSLIFKTN
jgi:hypothetical protein